MVFKTPYESSFRTEEEKSEETASTNKVRVVVPVCFKPVGVALLLAAPSQYNLTKIHTIWPNCHNFQSNDANSKFFRI